MATTSPTSLTLHDGSYQLSRGEVPPRFVLGTESPFLWVLQTALTFLADLQLRPAWQLPRTTVTVDDINPALP